MSQPTQISNPDHTTTTHYDVLGLAQTASTAEIRSAYKRLSLHYHPDKTGGGDATTFCAIKEAQDELVPSDARTAYDVRVRDNRAAARAAALAAAQAAALAEAEQRRAASKWRHNRMPPVDWDEYDRRNAPAVARMEAAARREAEEAAEAERERNRRHNEMVARQAQEAAEAKQRKVEKEEQDLLVQQVLHVMNVQAVNAELRATVAAVELGRAKARAQAQINAFKRKREETPVVPGESVKKGRER